MFSASESMWFAFAARDERLFAAQTKQLYAHASLGFSATLINSLVVVAVLRNEVAPTSLAVWWVSLTFVTVARFAVATWFNGHVVRGPFSAGRWAQWFIGGIALAGVLWGLSGVMLFPSSVPHQTFLAFVLGGMVAGAAATFSVRLDAFLAFSVPALTPMIVQLFRQGDEFHTAMGAMVSLFGLLLTGTAYRVSSLLNESLRARLEPEAEEPARRVTAEPAWDTEDEELDAQSKFARGVARRVEKYNATILSNVRLALRHPDLFEPGLCRDMLERIEEAASEGESLVEQLVDFSAEQKEDFEPVDLNDVIAATLDDWEGESGSRVELSRRLTENLPAVFADREQIRMMMTHLVANASHATGGHGRIEVTTGILASSEIAAEASTFEQSGVTEWFVVVEVTDDGMGMAPDVLDRIFDPFFTTKEKSLGMGLTIVQSILRRHAATVMVESAPRQGTRVRVVFPASYSTRPGDTVH